MKTLNTFLRSSNLINLLDSLRSLGGVHDVFRSSALLEVAPTSAGNLLDSLRSLGGVRDVFRPSALLEVGVFDTVAGPDLRGQ